MRTIATVCLALALAGCTAADGTPVTWEGPLPGDGTLTGFLREVANPGSIYKARQAAEMARQAADDAKCRELGFKPETDAYGNCRLQLEQIRATKQAAAARTRPRAAPVVEGVEQVGKVYDSSECIGPVIMGRCKGSIVPNKAYHPTCHGTWLNGQCTGPMF